MNYLPKFIASSCARNLYLVVILITLVASIWYCWNRDISVLISIFISMSMFYYFFYWFGSTVKSAVFRMHVSDYAEKLYNDHMSEELTTLLKGLTGHTLSDALLASRAFVSTQNVPMRNIALKYIFCLWILRHRSDIESDEIAIIFREISENDNSYTLSRFTAEIRDNLTSCSNECKEYTERIDANLNQLKTLGLRLKKESILKYQIM
jgi:hypothetical protein